MTTLNDVFADRQGLARQDVHAQLARDPSLTAAARQAGDDSAEGPGSALTERALAQLDALLDVDVSSILAGAWNRARDIREYGERSRKDPEKDFLLSLSEHSVRSNHKPYFDIVVNGVRKGRITFDVNVGLKLKGFQLVIRDGRILAMTTGPCEASGKVSLDGFVLLEEKSRPVALPGRIDLGEGLVIP